VTRLMLVLIALLVSSLVFADGHLGLLPASTQVEVGQTFDIQAWVTQPVGPFSAAAVNIGWDPAVLEYVPMPRSFEEAPLIPSACGLSFFARRIYPMAGAVDNVTAVHLYSSTLCNQRFLSGPGQVFTARFRAIANGATSLWLIRRILSIPTIRYDDSALWNGGSRISPLYLYDAAGQGGPAIGGGGSGQLQSATHPRPEGDGIATSATSTWGRIKKLYR